MRSSAKGTGSGAIPQFTIHNSQFTILDGRNYTANGRICGITFIVLPTAILTHAGRRRNWELLVNVSAPVQPPVATKDLDPVLVPFLQARDGRDAERALDKLIADQAQPLVRSIVGRKWRSSIAPVDRGHQADAELDVEDLQAEALGLLLTRLNEAKQNPALDPIADFRAYVAVTTYRACDMRLRQKYPNRWRLKSKVRYLLTHQRGLALWTGRQGEWIAGFDAWKDRSTEASERLSELRNGAQRAVDRYGTPQVSASSHPGDVAAAVFNTLGHPIELDDLVTAMGEILNEKDLPVQTESSNVDEDAPGVYDTATSSTNVAQEVTDRTYLHELWDQIVELPPNQRAALLLNLRDAEGRGVIALFPLQGIATVRQLADTLGLAPERFAELWHDLPLEDNAIAELLGLTRQQVISLRKVARERLARRMRHYNTD